MSTRFIKLKQNFFVDREEEAKKIEAAKKAFEEAQKTPVPGKPLPPVPRETDSDEELTLNWMQTAMGKGYPMQKSDNRRLFAAIFTKMETVRKAKGAYLELNEFEYTFVKRAFENYESPSEMSFFVGVAEQALLSATDSIPK